MDTELTPGQRDALLAAWHGAGGSAWGAVLAVAELARRFERENMAARGGTMTAQELDIHYSDIEMSHGPIPKLKRHHASQGARIVAAEAERDAAQVRVRELQEALDSERRALADHGACITRIAMLLGCTSSFQEVEAGVAASLHGGKVAETRGAPKPSGTVVEDERMVRCWIASGGTSKERKDTRAALLRLTAKAQAHDDALQAIDDGASQEGTSLAARIEALSEDRQSEKARAERAEYHRDALTEALQEERGSLEVAQHEVAQMDAALRVTVPELMERLTSSCVWCGKEPTSGLAPMALKEFVQAHVLTCPAHPLRTLEHERDVLKAELARLKPSGQVAVDVALIRQHMDQPCMPECLCAACSAHRALCGLAAGSQLHEHALATAETAVAKMARVHAATGCTATHTSLVAETRCVAGSIREAQQWRGLALRLLVLNVLAIAQWERYVRASTEAQDLGCPGLGKCHGSMAWCPAHGDVDLLCDMEGKCDLHRERWTEWVLERAPVAKIAREEGMEAGLTKARAEARQQVEFLQEKLRRARSDAWAEAVNVINDEPLASEAAKEAMAQVLGRIVPKQSPCGCDAVFFEGRWSYHRQDCPESFDSRRERENAIHPFLELARERLARRSYEPIPLEACTRLLKAFTTEDPHAK